MLVLAMVAGAQDIGSVFPLPDMNAQFYRPPIDAQRTMWTDDAATAPHGWYTARLYAGYVRGPIAAVFFNEREVLAVGDVVGLNLTGGVQLGPVRVGADLPVYLLATSGWENAAGGGLGDAALDVKASVLDPKDYPVGVAVGARLGLPTATVKLPLGSPKVQSEIQGIFDKEVGDVLLALNLGVRFGPKVIQDNVQLDDSLVVRLGAGYLITEMAGASLDVQMVRDFSQPGTDADGISVIGMPIEGMVGGWGRVSDDVVIRGGVGAGLTHGIGASAIRAVVSLGYEPSREADNDRDGLVNSIDDCPNDPEDFDDFEDLDGCPELDNDGDGILDVSDVCRMDPEDFDTWQDEDGCPDPLTMVRVAVVDGEGATITSAQTVIAIDETDAKTGTGSFEVELMPGEYQVEISAENFVSLNPTFTIPSGPPIDLEQVMYQSVVVGTVIAVLQDPEGLPVDGRVSWSESDSAATTAGRAELSIVEGRYALTATAEGYFEDSKNVEVVAGEESEAVFTLSKSQGTVSVSVVDAEGKAIPGATYTFGSDGVPQQADAESTEVGVAPGDYTVIARAEGYAPATAEVTVNAGAESAVTLTLSATKVKVTKARIEILEKVFFTTGKATIKTQSYSLLNEIAQILIDRPDISVRVEGHTDSRGSESSNQLLSERRASSVRTYLIQAGVSGDRLSSIGMGELQPIDTAQNETAWAKNRRVEFVIVSQ